MKKIIRAGLEVLYPRRCPVCDGLLGKREPLICGEAGISEAALMFPVREAAGAEGKGVLRGLQEDSPLV